jgi:hypothetical protein
MENKPSQAFFGQQQNAKRDFRFMQNTEPHLISKPVSGGSELANPHECLVHTTGEQLDENLYGRWVPKGAILFGILRIHYLASKIPDDLLRCWRWRFFPFRPSAAHGRSVSFHKAAMFIERPIRLRLRVLRYDFRFADLVPRTIHRPLRDRFPAF